MTWKSTAVASGLMVVGTWLASYAPVGGPRQAPAAAPSAAHTAAASAEIQREADRLHDRLRQGIAYRLPARNLFRFHAVPGKAPGRPPVEEIAPAPEPAPPALRMMLSGIAEDVVGDEIVRTAIISTPDDVHLVKIGETVGGTYRVSAIAAGAVELVRVDDGTVVQLSLKP
ncbi:MAG: hypothetical protein ACRD26_01565 [Vicinamibacterales bacterium]